MEYLADDEVVDTDIVVVVVVVVWYVFYVCYSRTRVVDGKKVFVIGHSGYPKTGPVKSEVDQNGGK
jgi:hypothetical protein